MNILFVTATRIGDAVLSTGVLGHLIERHPGARITVVAGPVAAPLFTAVPGLERLIALEKTPLSLHWVSLWGHLIGRNWDVLVDLRHAPLLHLVPARQRFHAGHSPKARHRVIEIASILGLADGPPAPRLWIGTENRARAQGLIPDGAPVLAIGPVANWAPKTWAAGNFIELIGRLTGENGILPGARVAFFGHASERDQAAPIIVSVPADRRIDLLGIPDLLDVAACLERTSFFVGNDSGLMHMAAASGIPTLGLFGPSKEDLYAPWGARAASVRTTESHADLTGPGFDHRRGGNLMAGLGVDRVETAARDLWQKTMGRA